jgi:uncharacterized repeat protein (TIGR03847 family)
MGVFFEFDDVDAFTVGTQGRPGERTFYLQARSDGRRVTLKCEKQQAAAILQYLRRVLSDLPPPQDKPMPSALELVEPIEASFVLGPVGLGYDRSMDRVLIQLEEVGEVDEEGELIPDDNRGHVRLYVNRGQAVAFCEQAEIVIEAGRPSCRWCGFPIDPDGHPCPRMN